MGLHTPATSTPPTDWAAIERDYRAGIKTLRQIGHDQGVSHVAINKRAKKFGWTRDLSAKIQAKADELVTKALVTNSVTNNPVTEARIVLENGAQAATIRLGHRKDIGRLRVIISAQMDELEASSGPEQAKHLRELGDMLREEDDNGRDRLNDVYRAVISLPERSKVAKQLADTLRIAIDLERREFGMDKDTGEQLQDALTVMLGRISGGGGNGFRPVAKDPEYGAD